MPYAMAINGSPRMEEGMTALVLDAFIQGMQAAGSEVELVYASRLQLKPCSCGVMHCWYRKPGECCLRDDMDHLYPKLRAADTLILATPVYIPLPGAMQTLINRLCPLVKPLLETREGRTRIQFHPDVAIQRIALVSTGAWWEIENLGTVLRIAEELAENGSVPFAGAVLRPHAFLMQDEDGLTPDGQAILEAARRAGSELVAEGAMCPETLQAISRPLISQEELRRRYNKLV